MRDHKFHPFAYRLAMALKAPNTDELLREMSNLELLEWRLTEKDHEAIDVWLRALRTDRAAQLERELERKWAKALIAAVLYEPETLLMKSSRNNRAASAAMSPILSTSFTDAHGNSANHVGRTSSHTVPRNRCRQSSLIRSFSAPSMALLRRAILRGGRS